MLTDLTFSGETSLPPNTEPARRKVPPPLGGGRLHKIFYRKKQSNTNFITGQPYTVRKAHLFEDEYAPESKFEPKILKACQIQYSADMTGDGGSGMFPGLCEHPERCGASLAYSGGDAGRRQRHSLNASYAAKTRVFPGKSPLKPDSAAAV